MSFFPFEFDRRIWNTIQYNTILFMVRKTSVILKAEITVRLKTGMDRNGPNNRNGPGITGTDLSFTYFFSFPIFVFLLFSSYLYAYRRPMHMVAKIA